MLAGRKASLIAVAAIAAHAIFLIFSAAKNSVTFDEAAHLPAGCAYLAYREFSIDNYNPPLMPMLTAVPVLMSGAEVPDPLGYRSLDPAARIWAYANVFERANRGEFHCFFFLARLVMIPISCAGAWLVFVWARQLYGNASAVAACALWALNPDILAHGSIAGADVGTAVAMTLALWTWQRFCAKPRPGRALIAGFATAVAHLCKLTSLLLWPAFVVILVVELIRSKQKLRDLAVGLVVVGITTLVLINLCYGYNRSFEPISTFDFRSSAMRSMQESLGWLPAPLPRQLVLGIDSLKWEWEMGFPGYLLGENYIGGRRSYYIVALASKLPVSVLALILATVVSLIFDRRAKERALLLSLIVLIIGMATRWQLNLGVRHLLPLYPLAFILISRLWTMTTKIRASASVVLVILAIESLSVCPRYLTFFNAFAGGPSRGWKIVNDSNFDWGQGLLDLKDWIDRYRAGRIELAYFGLVDPQTYDIDYVPFGEGTDEQYVAISSYFLVGQRQRMSSSHGVPYKLQIPYYQKLQQLKPVAVPSGTIFIFTRQQLEAARDN